MVSQLDKSVSETGQLKLKTIGVSPIISAGFDYAIQKKMQIAIGFSFINTSLGVNEVNYIYRQIPAFS